PGVRLQPLGHLSNASKGRNITSFADRATEWLSGPFFGGNHAGMIQFYAASFGFWLWRGAVAGGRSLWSLVRPGLRFISTLLLLAAIIALTSDVTRWQTGAEGPMFRSLESQIRLVAPATLDNIGVSISQSLHPVVWNPMAISVLALPAWAALVIAALVLGYAARERQQVNIFIN
ncbi:MAG: hypothetical protein KKB37_11655, partial [Alphaproteobacteria bacterium]|nr:hypothetical protein [Alphaproteobacteria bacterium]